MIARKTSLAERLQDIVNKQPSAATNTEVLRRYITTAHKVQEELLTTCMELDEENQRLIKEIEKLKQEATP